MVQHPLTVVNAMNPWRVIKEPPAAIAFVAVALLLTCFSLAQGNPTTQSTVLPDEIESSERFSLTISTEKDTFAQGEAITLHLDLYSGTQAIRWECWPAGWMTLGPSVKRADGRKVPFRSKAYDFLRDGSWHSASLEPGQHVQVDYPLTDIYDVGHSGRYLISAVAEIWQPSDADFVQLRDRRWLKSNVITIRIIESPAGQRGDATSKGEEKATERDADKGSR
jgi:hypothetical protein